MSLASVGGALIGEINLEQDDREEVLSRFVKPNKDILILSILGERPMCGYDLIKEIYRRYNVLLSQGAVYPILYSMVDDGILRSEYSRGNMRTKIYTLTPKGQEVMRRKIGKMVYALEYMLSFLKGSCSE
ncbi:PadR family transcriptional regulator [Methanothrix thermoacetophila]|uniref:Transcriptional regulator, PadR family n=1 Tax=Methanothrix thermoacetophila (strain DSM 6194 / JCM 14653 / NBRC 101360 / PT) TaxID=349307 RepID=A0B595_METTP|nr:PadR family transcriptional regulator [Methanothrix thermoacetophila]ABK13869.1 transcriptional regulator, PadR family [Methanothrix thermoacetophila PT]